MSKSVAEQSLLERMAAKRDQLAGAVAAIENRYGPQCPEPAAGAASKRRRLDAFFPAAHQILTEIDELAARLCALAADRRAKATAPPPGAS